MKFINIKNGNAYRDTDGGAKLFVRKRFHVCYQSGGYCAQSWEVCTTENDTKRYIREYVTARNAKENSQ